jgi:hypothetical protein
LDICAFIMCGIATVICDIDNIVRDDVIFANAPF